MVFSADNLEDWRQALAGAVKYECAPEARRARVRELLLSGARDRRPQDLAGALAVGACGEGLRGHYRRADLGCFLCEGARARVEYVPELGIWALSRDEEPQDKCMSLELEEAREFYGLRTDPAGSLLYACLDDAPTGRWFAVLGAGPAPTVQVATPPPEPLLLAAMPLLAAAAGPGRRLLPDTVTAGVLAFLYDFRGTRWRACDFGFCRAPCGITAPQIGRHLKGVLRDACQGAVCRAWAACLQRYAASWKTDVAAALQLPALPGLRVASLPSLARLCLSTSWISALGVTHSQVFQASMWPLHVYSVQTSTLCDGDPLRPQALERGLLWRTSKAFAAFAWELLHDVPLAWRKGMQGTCSYADSAHVQSGMICSDGGPEYATASFLHEPYHKGFQSCCPVANMLSTPVGLATLEGAPIDSRLRGALRVFAAACNSTASLELVARTSSWSAQLRRRPSEKCRRCKRAASQQRPVRHCYDCGDLRAWSFLERKLTLEFQGFDAVMAREVTIEFSLCARVLPFVSTSDDRAELSDASSESSEPASSDESALEDDDDEDDDEEPEEAEESGAEPEEAAEAEAEAAPEEPAAAEAGEAPRQEEDEVEVPAAAP